MNMTTKQWASEFKMVIVFLEPFTMKVYIGQGLSAPHFNPILQLLYSLGKRP
jgi:hypothetical protein